MPEMASALHLIARNHIGTNEKHFVFHQQKEGANIVHAKSVFFEVGREGGYRAVNEQQGKGAHSVRGGVARGDGSAQISPAVATGNKDVGVGVGDDRIGGSGGPLRTADRKRRSEHLRDRTNSSIKKPSTNHTPIVHSHTRTTMPRASMPTEPIRAFCSSKRVKSKSTVTPIQSSAVQQSVQWCKSTKVLCQDNAARARARAAERESEREPGKEKTGDPTTMKGQLAGMGGSRGGVAVGREDCAQVSKNGNLNSSHRAGAAATLLDMSGADSGCAATQKAGGAGRAAAAGSLLHSPLTRSLRVSPSACAPITPNIPVANTTTTSTTCNHPSEAARKSEPLSANRGMFSDSDEEEKLSAPAPALTAPATTSNHKPRTNHTPHPRISQLARSLPIADRRISCVESLPNTPAAMTTSSDPSTAGGPSVTRSASKGMFSDSDEDEERGASLTHPAPSPAKALANASQHKSRLNQIPHPHALPMPPAQAQVRTSQQIRTEILLSPSSSLVPAAAEAAAEAKQPASFLAFLDDDDDDAEDLWYDFLTTFLFLGLPSAIL